MLKEALPLSSFLLRLTALLCMIVDHAGLALFPNVGLFRCVGRAAFPLYCFLLVQGYLHTRNLRAYMRRLLLLAILSEIPFDLLIFGSTVSLMEQNAVFSLLLGLLAVCAADTMEARGAWPMAAAALLALSAMILRVSYGWLPVALCLAFYYGRDRRSAAVLAAACALLLYTLSLLLSGVAMSWVLVSLCALLALLPILLFNGKRGLRSPAMSLLFYAAYPLHILALLVIRALRIVPPYFLD